MKKNFLQDVIPPVERRSIRDIPIPHNKKHTTNNGDDVIKIRTQEDPPPPPTHHRENIAEGFLEDKSTRSKKTKLISILLFAIFVVCIFFVNRTKAEVTIIPKQENLSIAQTIEIFDKNLSPGNSKGIGYKKLSIEKNALISVSPSGEQDVSQKASGKIKVFNNNTSKTKTLIANTRFETDKGLIFRVPTNVEIPGYKEESGKRTPGEIDIEVIADQPGDKFNIGKTNFTIPGFKGFPDLYSSIYAQSVTDMSGGFEGKKKVVSEEDKSKALENLKTQAKEQIAKEVTNFENQFVIIFGDDDITYSRLSEEESGNNINLSLTATVNAYAFDLNELAQGIVKQNIPSTNPEGATIQNKNDIKFEIQKTENNPESLNLNGIIKFVWSIDSSKLKNLLEEKNKNEFASVIANYPGISSAESSISPFWKNNFPKASKIKIIIKE